MSTDNPVVIDLGSESIKAGYAAHVPSEHEPRIITPSLVTINGRSNGFSEQPQASTSGRSQRLIDRGHVTSFECLDSMLNYLLYEQLGWVEGEEGSVLFVEQLFHGKAEREQLAQLMFEGFNAMGIFLHDAAVCSLFAVGKLAGCSIDIGHGTIDVATVTEGVTNAPGAVRMSFAGEQLTELLGKLVQQQGIHLQPHQLNALKIQCCRAAASADAYHKLMQNPAAAVAAAAASSAEQPSSSSAPQQPQDSQEYTLPDGTKICITTEGHQVTEALFDPTLLGHSTPGIVDCILESLNDHPDPSLKRSIVENVLISGGGACIPGIGRRILQDMQAQLPNSLAPTLAQLPEYMALQSPHYIPWVGGAVMAKLVAYQSHFMIKAEYEEIGPSAVHRKCA